tara:strand:+ start:1571 stop:2722 length:1152 start_codon:yes stop_codon:yes gene_type:complete
MINVLKPKYRTNEVLESIRECLDTGWTGLGGKTIDFEKAWKDYTKLPNAHFLNSATSGLHLALNVFKSKYNWKEGDEVITTPLTFVSTNHVILYEKLNPIFADVDEYMCMDPKDVLKKITPKTKALIFVGLGGNSGQLSVIKKICEENNIKLILDAAHMSGTITREMFEYGCIPRHVGWEADVSVFSFQAVKNLPTSDSGMVCFKEEEDDKLARQLSWLGIDKDTYSRYNGGSYKWKYDVPNVGFKYHGNALTAAIGIVQLKYLDEDNAYRRNIAKIYDDELSQIHWCDSVKVSSETQDSSRHLFQLIVPEEDRDNLIEFLYGKDIYPGVHYIDNTLYNPYKKHHGSCPKAHEYSNKLITLPIHCNLKEIEMYEVIKQIKRYK